MRPHHITRSLLSLFLVLALQTKAEDSFTTEFHPFDPHTLAPDKEDMSYFTYSFRRNPEPRPDPLDEAIKLLNLPEGSNTNVPFVAPGAFETRESGHILNITATLSPDQKTVQVAIIPEKAELTGWLSYGVADKDKPPVEAKPGAISQPLFRSFNFTTTVTVRPGEQADVGGSPHPETGEPIYGIITARIIDVLPGEEP